MRARLALAILIMLLSAGCAAPGTNDVPANAESGAEGPAVVFEDYAIDGATVSREELENATLGEEHAHDAWGEAEELVLLETTVEAGACDGEMDLVFYAMLSVVTWQEANVGCAPILLPRGTVVPEGTGALRIEVDATDALKVGSMWLDWRNKAREENGDTTTEAVHTWEVALTQADWDVPHAEVTTFIIYVGARGPVGVFSGEVDVRVVAERLEGWEPIVAIAHVDHWKLPALHDFAAPGVMRLFDGEASVQNVDASRITSPEAGDPVQLSDIIAPGARFVTIVSDTTATDCAPGLACRFVPGLNVGGYERQRFGTLIHEEGARRVYSWTVPDEVSPDSVYADASTTTIDPRIDACIEGQPGSCGTVSILSGSATARLQAFAWQDDVDLDLLTSIAGPPAS